MYNDPNFFYYSNPANYSYANYGNKIAKAGLLSKLRGIKWGDILNNTSRTLNVINQAIPVVYQVKPLFSNAKTMLKIANIIKSDDKSKPTDNKQTSRQRINHGNETNSHSITKKEETKNSFSSSQPTFFL